MGLETPSRKKQHIKTQHIELQFDIWKLHWFFLWAVSERGAICLSDKIDTRWFQVTKLYPLFGGHDSPLKGSRFHHPKKGSSRIARYFLFYLSSLKLVCPLKNDGTGRLWNIFWGRVLSYEKIGCEECLFSWFCGFLQILPWYTPQN